VMSIKIAVPIFSLLQGTKTKKEYEEIFLDLSALHYFEENKEIWKKASLLGFELRRKGKTIPSTDLLIASISLYYDLDILHADNHFEIIKLYSNLKTTDLNKI